MKTHRITPGFTKPIEHVTYSRDLTSVDRWLEQHMKRSDARWTESEDLYAHYRLHTEEPVSNIAFGRRLSALGVQNYRAAAGRGWGIVEKEQDQ